MKTTTHKTNTQIKRLNIDRFATAAGKRAKGFISSGPFQLMTDARHAMAG